MENSITHQQNLLNIFYNLRFDTYTDLAVEYRSAKFSNKTPQQSTVHQAIMNQSPVNQEGDQAIGTFQQAINFLVQTIAPEKIFLTPDFQETGNSHLIIIVREDDHATFQEREKLQEHPLLKREHITLQFIKGYAFECEYQSCPIYFSVTCNPQTLVYDDGCFALPELNRAALADVKTKANQLFYQGMERMDTFLDSAIIFRTTNPEVAAFHLHQAVELGLNALVRSVTGAVKTTHVLRRLLQSTLPCNPEIYQIMTDGQAADEQLLDQLEEGYLGYRYKNNYQMTTQHLTQLIAKVTALRNAVESTFLEWLLRYELEILDIPDYE